MYLPAHERRRLFPDVESVTIDEFTQDPDVKEQVAFGGYEGTVAMEFYHFVGACRYLAGGECSVHEQRPSACRNFEVDSEDCKIIRLENIS